MSRRPARGWLEHHALDPVAAEAWRALAVELARVEDSGRVIPCRRLVADAWLADDPLERAEAATACGACPVLAVCAAYADTAGEAWGVWAGTDRSSPRATTDADHLDHDRMEIDR